MVRDDRLGRFYISREIVESSPRKVRRIMGKCVVIRCECDYSRDRFEYTAISPLFYKVARGMMIPIYDVYTTGYRGVKFTNCRWDE